MTIQNSPTLSLHRPMRQQVCLNGEWEIGGTVPVYSGVKADSVIYQRQVDVPADWQGKIIRLEFEKVNHIADIYINDRFIGDHIGGWIPFSFDLTPWVKPGTSFKLRMVVRDATHQPISDGQRHALWPIGAFNIDASHTGIVDNVWLRAYGQVHIEDVFIQTSFRQRRLKMDYTLKNETPQMMTFRIEAEVIRADNGTVEKRLAAASMELPAGMTKIVPVNIRWDNPALWMPDNPNLYFLHSRLLLTIENRSEVLDEETRRFGFREIWIDGNQFVLNGMRVNLWGDSIPMAWFTNPRAAQRLTPETWPQTVTMLMSELNYRVVRFHQSPAPTFTLETADELGLLIINESALYGRPFYKLSDKTIFMRNTLESWIGPWITANRNHPSIFMWSAMNEMNFGIDTLLTREQCLAVGDAIRTLDPTRPITYDGDGDLGDAVNDHYPEGYETVEAVRNGSIYDWENLSYNPAARTIPHPSKPTGFGEFLACPWVESIKPDVYWWHGTWVRGMRYLNFTDIRPFVMQWAWDDSQPAAKQNIKNSFSPVALFDYDYDGLGIAPLMDDIYPSLEAGAAVQRHLVLYNDEYRDQSVAIEVCLQSGGTIYATGTQTYDLPLGEHRDLTCSFWVPATGGQVLEIVLTTRKGGVIKFSEVKKFTVIGENSPAASQPNDITFSLSSETA